MLKSMAHPVLDYFGVEYMDQIRFSPKFRQDIEPLFQEGFTLFLEPRQDNPRLIVHGLWKTEDKDKPGIYGFEVNGQHKGCCTLAGSTY